MSGTSGFRLEGDLQVNIQQVGPKMKRAMVAAANFTAPQAEAYMKSNAKWTDRTGAARNGLSTQVQVSQNNVAIVLYHTVPYGVFLEVRWGGKYGIIEQTMIAMGPVFVQAIGRLAFGSGGL